LVVWALRPEGIYRLGGLFDLMYSPARLFFLGRVLENACERGLVFPAGVSWVVSALPPGAFWRLGALLILIYFRDEE
jgi:Na+-translocating ferredoxin:NAD+ oxidoreductase RnfE subunit